MIHSEDGRSPQCHWGLVSRKSHMLFYGYFVSWPRPWLMAKNSRRSVHQGSYIWAYSCLQVTLHSHSSLSESLHSFLPARPHLYMTRYYSRSCRIDMGVFLALGQEIMEICLLWPLFSLLALVLGPRKHICEYHDVCSCFYSADCASTNLRLSLGTRWSPMRNLRTWLLGTRSRWSNGGSKYSR